MLIENWKSEKSGLSARCVFAELAIILSAMLADNVRVSQVNDEISSIIQLKIVPDIIFQYPARYLRVV